MNGLNEGNFTFTVAYNPNAVTIVAHQATSARRSPVSTTPPSRWCAAGSFTVTTTGSPTPSLSNSGALPSGVTFDHQQQRHGHAQRHPGSRNRRDLPPDLHRPQRRRQRRHPELHSHGQQANQAPAITSGNSTTFTIGAAGSFTVTTTGFPTSEPDKTGALPGGVTFADNGNGTATLSGTPTAGAGTYPLTFTAHNGVGSDATQNFTLTVNGGTQPDNAGLLLLASSGPALQVGAGATVTVTGKLGAVVVDSVSNPAAIVGEPLRPPTLM